MGSGGFGFKVSSSEQRPFLYSYEPEFSDVQEEELRYPNFIAPAYSLLAGANEFVDNNGAAWLYNGVIRTAVSHTLAILSGIPYTHLTVHPLIMGVGGAAGNMRASNQITGEVLGGGSISETSGILETVVKETDSWLFEYPEYAVTLALTVESVINFQFTRYASHAGDTYEDSLLSMGWKLYWT